MVPGRGPTANQISSDSFFFFFAIGGSDIDTPADRTEHWATVELALPPVRMSFVLVRSCRPKLVRIQCRRAWFPWSLCSATAASAFKKAKWQPPDGVMKSKRAVTRNSFHRSSRACEFAPEGLNRWARPHNRNTHVHTHNICEFELCQQCWTNPPIDICKHSPMQWFVFMRFSG